MSTLPHSELSELPTHWSRLSVSRLHYRVSWSTRGRRPVLTADRATALEEILRERCRALGARLEAVTVQPDRVQLLLSLRPSESVGGVVRELKGRSALDLLERRPDLRLSLGGHLVWAETYGVSTLSPLGLERRKARLAECARHTEGETTIPRC